MAKGVVEKIVLPILAFLLVAWNMLHVAIMFDKTPDNDFSKAWYSTVAFVHGGEMYGYNESITAYFGQQKTPVNLWNLNPPHYHLIVLPFALLPLMRGIFVWVLVTLAFMFLGLRWVSREIGLKPEHRPLAIVGFLAFAGTGVTLLCCHCSYLLTVVVLGMWMAARRGQWVRAGLWLGVGMSVKPFLLIMLPYLLLKRRWDALAAAFGMALTCFAVGVAVFGVHNHLEWMSRVRNSGEWSWLYANGSIYGLFTRTLTANPVCSSLVDGPRRLATCLWLGIGIPMGIVTLRIAAKDSSKAGVDRAMALLLIAALMLSPLGWLYYYCLPLGPVVMVAMTWWQNKETSSPWSRRLLVAGGMMFLWPMLQAGIWQPQLWSTLVIGNLYSYGTLLVWLALVVDGIRVNQARPAAC